MGRTPIALLVRLAEGGMKKHILQLAKGLNKDSFEIHLFAPTSILEEIKSPQVICLPTDISGIVSVTQKIYQIFFLANYLSKKQIKLLHCHGYLASIMGSISAGLARTPTQINTYHNLVSHRPHTFLQQKFYFALCRRGIRQADHIIAVSKAVKEELIQKIKIPEERISVVYNGLEAGKCNTLFPQPCKRPIIAMIGRLTYEKGVDLFLECASLLSHSGFNPEFWIVGEGPEKKSAMDNASKLGLSEKVSFLGFRNDISELISAIDVLVIPSRNEGLSMVALEGMALNKPIVSFSVGALPEVIVNGVTGLLVNPFKTSLLADAVLTLLRNKKMANIMGYNGGIRVREMFSIKEMIRKTEALYYHYLTNDKRS